MAKTNEERIADLLTKLDELHKQTVHVWYRQKMWEQIEALAKKNPWIGQPGNIMQFIRESHFEAMALFVRRARDMDKNALSLKRLLNQVACEEVKLTRSHYVEVMCNRQTNAPAVWKERAMRDFDEWAGSESDVYPVERACRHMKIIDHVARPVLPYATKRLAHFDKSGVSPSARIGDVLRAMRWITLIEIHYHVVLTGVQYGMDSPTLPPTWNMPFQLPWLVWPRWHDGLCTPWHPDRPGRPHDWRRSDPAERAKWDWL